MIEQYSWKRIDVFTTRPARVNDSKIAICSNCFETLLEAKVIILPTYIYGERYGLNAGLVSEAQSSKKKYYIVDFSFENLSLWDAYDALKFLVSPKDSNSLTRLLKVSNREGSDSQIISQIEYAISKSKTHPDIKLLENVWGELDQVAKTLYDTVTNQY